MVQIGLAPCYYGLDSTADLMSETLKMARHHGIRCHSHLAEGKTETAYAIEKLGCRPLEYVEKLGWLGEDISYAHGIHFNDEELKLIAETGTGIAHCPTCNMFVSSGVCRVPDLLELGATVGLGVDGTASSTSSNMMTEIRVAYLVHQLTYGGRGPSPEQVLEIATRGGAKILGRDDIGHLAEGMAADLAMMDWSRLQYAGGKNDPVACIVTSGDARMVDTVFVNGKMVVQKGELTMIDENSEANQINDVASEFLEKAAVRIDGLNRH